MMFLTPVACVAILLLSVGQGDAKDSSDQGSTSGDQGRAPADYQTRSAKAKLDYLWSKVAGDVYQAGSPLPTNVTADRRNLANLPYLARVYNQIASDEMPVGQRRLIHEYSVVGKVQLEIFRNSPYTGLFQAPGAAHGIARLSIAKPDDTVLISASIALKVLVDGKSSLNFHVLETIQGRFATDRNFFSQRLTNISPPPLSPSTVGLFHNYNETLPLMKPEDRPESYVKLGLLEQASLTAKGESVANVIAPWKIDFVPNPVLRASQSTAPKGDFRVALQAIPENTVLYDIVLTRQEGLPGLFVGRLVLRSPLVASRYGDEVLFFQHNARSWKA